MTFVNRLPSKALFDSYKKKGRSFETPPQVEAREGFEPPMRPVTSMALSHVYALKV